MRPDTQQTPSISVSGEVVMTRKPDAEIPSDWILDRVTGSHRSVTDYILEAPVKCPNCRRPIFEKTLVEPE